MSAFITDVDFVLARVADPDQFERWLEMARSAGWCEHPVRLSGTTRQIDPRTGEILSSYTTEDEPDGQLLKACGTRRATSCEPCSAVYRADAWHLIAAGLRGGKGVPKEVSTHPTLFVTLTAPSFGRVHSRRDANGLARMCNPHGPPQCRHSRRIHCEHFHESADERLGEPLCPDCFDYTRAVLWNAHATELWRRTTIGIQRHLAKVIGLGSSRFTEHARLSYAKVVEYQDRGLIHLHVIVRLDGPAGAADPPPEVVTFDGLEAAVVRACHRAHFTYPTTRGVSGEIRWGKQIDVRRVAPDSSAAGAVAAYISKYATKSTDAFGHLDRRLLLSDLDLLNVRPHLRRLVRVAWELGGRPELEHLKLQSWAHTLGFRGHWLTKSRRYSTTLGALRSARAVWSASRQGGDSGCPNAETIKDWRYSGRGWDNPGDEWLARTAAAAKAEARQLARRARLDDQAKSDG